MQAKDVDERRVLAAIVESAAERSRQWATSWDIRDRLPDVPPKVLMAKLRAMVKKGLIDGGVSSISEPWTRGDFELTERGRALLGDYGT